MALLGNTTILEILSMWLKILFHLQNPYLMLQQNWVSLLYVELVWKAIPIFELEKNVVIKPLRCLQLINPLYADITINEEIISSLPADGNIANQFPFIEEGSVSEQPLESENIEENAVPFAPRLGQEAAVQSILNWPTASTEPINEFRQTGYIPLAVPHLFPDGKYDFLDFSRAIKVSFREWIDYLINF